MNVHALRSFFHEWRPVLQGALFVFLVVSAALLCIRVFDPFVRVYEWTTAEAQEEEETQVLGRKPQEAYVKICDQQPTWVSLGEGPDDGLAIGTIVTVHYGVGPITNYCYAIDVTTPAD